MQPVARRVVGWSVAGAAYGAGLGAWLQGAERIVLGAAVGLIVGAFCGMADASLNRSIAWAIRRTPNRALAGAAGAAIGTAVSAGLALLILGAVGWVGSCWG